MEWKMVINRLACQIVGAVQLQFQLGQLYYTPICLQLLAEHSSYFRGLLSGSFCHLLRHVCTGLSLHLRLVFPGGVAFPLQAHQVWHFSDMSSQTILHALRVDLAYLLC